MNTNTLDRAAKLCWGVSTGLHVGLFVLWLVVESIPVLIASAMFAGAALVIAALGAFGVFSGRNES